MSKYFLLNWLFSIGNLSWEFCFIIWLYILIYTSVHLLIRLVPKFGYITCLNFAPLVPLDHCLPYLPYCLYFYWNSYAARPKRKMMTSDLNSFFMKMLTLSLNSENWLRRNPWCKSNHLSLTVFLAIGCWLTIPLC